LLHRLLPARWKTWFKPAEHRSIAHLNFDQLLFDEHDYLHEIPLKPDRTKR